MKWLDYWLEERLCVYENIVISRANLHVLNVPDEERAFYSKGTYDIEYDFPFGRQELEGVAYRTDYDLSQHQKASGKSLEYFDDETKQKFISHVVEPSAGVDRTVLALICEAYSEDEAPDEKGKMETRTVLRFHPRMAPIKCAVFPLLKNKEQLVAKAKEIVDLLRPQMFVFYDESGAIGRRYRRQDEIGTPFGLTVDFETLGEKDASLRDTVTLRERDSIKGNFENLYTWVPPVTRSRCLIGSSRIEKPRRCTRATNSHQNPCSISPICGLISSITSLRASMYGQLGSCTGTW